MRPVMIAMGSLLLAGNLLFAVPLRQSAVVIRNAEQADVEVRREIEEVLRQKGLEADAAQRMVSEQYGRSGSLLSQAFTHFALLFPEFKREAILSHAAERALRGERFAFDDYDQLVAMLQRLQGPNLSDAHFERLRHCVLLNRSLLRTPSALPA